MGDGRGLPHGGSSSLVVVGRISEGKLQPVGLGQEDAHFLVAPVHRGQVLQEDHQTLRGVRRRERGVRITKQTMLI